MAESMGRASCQYQYEPAVHKEQGGCANTRKTAPLFDCCALHLNALHQPLCRGIESVYTVGNARTWHNTAQASYISVLVTRI